MKRFILALTSLPLFASLAFAGSYSGKEMKQTVPAPCPQWYADNEWNVSVWGTYVFTGTEFAPNPDLGDIVMSASEGHPVYGVFDKYLGDDHAWGGGADIKYFFHRYFGIGVEGFALNARKSAFELESNDVDIFIHDRFTRHRAVGEVLGTFTLRYPVPCTRFAPYVWAGGGTIFGGGEQDKIGFEGFLRGDGPDQKGGPLYHTRHFGEHTEAVGQFGGGLEVRITPHIGWMTDYSWNVVDGNQNNFGGFRSGINFAF
jgi:hypothetical protein